MARKPSVLHDASVPGAVIRAVFLSRAVVLSLQGVFACVVPPYDSSASAAFGTVPCFVRG